MRCANLKHRRYDTEYDTGRPVGLVPVSYTHLDVYKRQVTDTITIRATNVSNASTYRDVSASVTNSVVSSDNLVVTSYSYPTISYSGGSV